MKHRASSRRTLLDRQLARIGIGRDAAPTLEQWRAFVATVERSYGDVDALERVLDVIVEELPVMVFVKDAVELCFLRINRAGEELLGVPRDQLLGKTVHDVMPIEDAEILSATDRGVIASRRVVTLEDAPIETPHGTRRITARLMPILDELGEPRFLLGIADEHAHCAQLSHEMRTPLNAILGFARLLHRSAMLAEDRDMLGHIVQAGEHLLVLVDELLDLNGVAS